MFSTHVFGFSIFVLKYLPKRIMMPVICFQIIQVVNNWESKCNKISYDSIIVESQVISTWSSYYSP